MAGGDIRLNASGAGDGSDLAIIGSEVNAGNDVQLAAEGDIRLEAAQNRSTLDRDSEGSRKK